MAEKNNLAPKVKWSLYSQHYEWSYLLKHILHFFPFTDSLLQFHLNFLHVWVTMLFLFRLSYFPITYLGTFSICCHHLGCSVLNSSGSGVIYKASSTTDWSLLLNTFWGTVSKKFVEPTANQHLMALFLQGEKKREGVFAQIILLFILPLLFTNHGFVLFSMFSSPALHNETLHWKARGTHRLVWPILAWIKFHLQIKVL